MSLSPQLKNLLKRAAAAKDKLQRQLFLAAAISSSFEEKGIRAVLVGGAAVEYYTGGGYTTADIDMVLPPLDKGDIEAVMKGLGFERFEDYRHWLHPDIPIPVEFPPGPVQVGRLLVQKINEIEIGKAKLGIMRVEDILLDRIVMAQEWKDRQAEVQAEMLMYAHYKEMDWSDTHQKASRIGVLKLFEKIQRKVKRKTGKDATP